MRQQRSIATYGAHTSLSPERKISQSEIHSEGKVVFDSLPLLFLYNEYKIRKISIFYSLEFIFYKGSEKGDDMNFVFYVKMELYYISLGLR